MKKAYELIKSKKYLYPRLERDIVNMYYNFSDFLSIPNWGAIFCPFHEDTNKPSAKLYKDEDGIEKIWCFAERKMYFAYDYIKLILEKDPLKLLTEEVSEEELTLAVKDYIANVGKSQMRKSKLEGIDLSNLEEKEFIELICTGVNNVK